MKKAFLPRAFAAISAAIITFTLFDQVATMGGHPESATAASAARVVAASPVAVTGA